MFLSAKHQYESAIGMYMSPPSWTSLPSPCPSHSSLLQSPSLSSLSHTANSHWLSILCKVMLSFHLSLSIHPTLSFPHHPPYPRSISLFSIMSVSPLLPWFQVNSYPLFSNLDFRGGELVKNPPANAGCTRDVGLIPGSGRSLGVGSILAWKIP